MADDKTKSTSDEQVYQSNKREPAVREVYSNENDEPAVEAGQDLESRDQDEALAETFPASDPPATSSSVPVGNNE